MRKYYIENNEEIPAIVYSESQPEGYTEITDGGTLLDLTKKDYKKKEADGHDFYNGFRSNLRLAVNTGEISIPDSVTVENYLSDIMDNLLTGNWLTAKYICENKPTSGIFNDSLKAQILSGITSYVESNY